MSPWLYALVCLITAFRLCRSQSATFNLDKFKVAADKDGTGNITLAELEDLFFTISGRNTADRCSFMDWLMARFWGSSSRASVMFDLMQFSNGMVSKENFSQAFLGGSDIIDVSPSTLTANVKALDDRIDRIIIKPADYVDGPTFWRYDLFEIQRWADNSDQDKNNYISRLELSAAMRALDENGDWQLLRCEFVNSMTDYKQHSVTASKIYSDLFYQRDKTWADVDSDFVLLQISKGGGDVTKKMFVDHFSQINQIFAGIYTADGDGLPGDARTPHTSNIFFCLISSVLVFLFQIIVL